MVSLKDFAEKPFAGPGTKEAYETALGRFLVAFNRTDNLVRSMVDLALKDCGMETLWPILRNDMYQHQVANLRMLAISIDGLKHIQFGGLLELNGRRNMLAHGHYKQDLFSDDFEIVGRDRATVITIDDINKLTSSAQDMAYELENTRFHLWYNVETSMDDDEQWVAR